MSIPKLQKGDIWLHKDSDNDYTIRWEIKHINKTSIRVHYPDGEYSDCVIDIQEVIEENCYKLLRRYTYLDKINLLKNYAISSCK